MVILCMDKNTATNLPTYWYYNYRFYVYDQDKNGYSGIYFILNYAINELLNFAEYKT